MLQKNKQIITRILFTVFTFYYVNVCFFTHTHIVNGTTIVHSHIHNKAHAQTGTHNDSELTLIASLSAFQTLVPIVDGPDLGVFSVLREFLLPFCEERIISCVDVSISLRAPPTCF